MIKEVFVLAYLAALSFEDYREKEISLLLTTGGAFVIVGLSLWSGEPSITDMLASLIPGFVLLALSVATAGAIGAGDGTVLLGLGLGCGLQVVLETLFWGGLLGGVCALVILIRTKDKRKSIPFLPFILGGFVMSLGISAFL